MNLSQEITVGMLTMALESDTSAFATMAVFAEGMVTFISKKYIDLQYKYIYSP